MTDSRWPTSLMKPPKAYWPYVLLACILSILVLWIPFVGMIFVFGYAIPSCLLNFTAVQMIIDVRRKATPTAILIIPVICYGAYGVTYFQADQLAHKYKASIEKSNADKRIEFDPNRQVIVADYPIAQRLIRDYVIPKVVVSNENGQGVTSGRETTLRVVPTTDCNRMEIMSPNQTGDVRIEKITGGEFESVICILALNESSNMPKIKLNADTIGYSADNLKFLMHEAKIYGLNGKSIALRAGTITYMSPIPMIFSGCFMDNCFNGFGQQTLQVGIRDHQNFNAADPGLREIAVALNLRKRTSVTAPDDKTGLTAGFAHEPAFILTPSEIAPDAKEAIARAQAFANADVDKHISWFKRALRGDKDAMREEANDARTQATWVVLIDHMDRVSSLAPEMLRGLKSAIEARDGEFVLTVGHVIANLPKKEFASVSAQLLELAPQSDYFSDAPVLLHRLGDVGPKAVPIFLKVLERA